MRKLTITRRKSIAACAMTLKVYIHDNSGVCDLTIDGFPCRLYGKLKNGKTETFEISNDAVRVYVTADKVSSGYCNDVYIIPAGQEDIELSGACKLNPATGNAFRFDNNDNPEAIANRKKGSQKGLIILVVAILVGILIGLFM